jgi:hypothetical protein
MSRESIFREVAEERARQDTLFGGATHDDTHRPSDWVAILTRHVGLATDDGSPAGVCMLNHQVAGSDPARWRRQMIRVAAVAVAALESYERKLAAIMTPPDPLIENEAPSVSLRDMAQQLANEWGEPALAIHDPPPGLEYERHLPYAVLASLANAKELKVGVKVNP